MLNHALQLVACLLEYHGADEIEKRLWEMVNSTMRDEINCDITINCTYLDMYKDITIIFKEFEKLKEKGAISTDL